MPRRDFRIVRSLAEAPKDMREKTSVGMSPFDPASVKESLSQKLVSIIESTRDTAHDDSEMEMFDDDNDEAAADSDYEDRVGDSDDAQDFGDLVDDDMFNEPEGTAAAASYEEVDEEVDLEDMMPDELTISSPSATKALMRELQKMVAMNEREKRARLAKKEGDVLGIALDLGSTSNLYRWRVHLTEFDPELPLAKDMTKQGVERVELEVRFGPDYPHSPPYIRIIQPVCGSASPNFQDN